MKKSCSLKLLPILRKTIWGEYLIFISLDYKPSMPSRISVIIPAFNEEQSIALVIAALPQKPDSMKSSLSIITQLITLPGLPSEKGRKSCC